MIDIKELQDIIEIPLPSKPQPTRTILDIAGVDYRETVISNIYKYLFDKNEDHNYNNIFLKALLLCMPESIANRFNDIEEWIVESEFRTDNGGRIDILIREVVDNKSKFIGRNIVIENKIYHHLNNDLNDYLKTVGGKGKKNIGVILSPNKSAGNTQGFIHISHIELLNIVNTLISQQGIDKDPILFALNQSINNHTKAKHNLSFMERIIFYLKHRDKINSLIELESEFKKVLFDSISALANDSNGKWTVLLQKRNSKSLMVNRTKKISLYFEINQFHDPLNISLYFKGVSVAKRAEKLKSNKSLNSLAKTFKIEKYNLGEWSNDECTLFYKSYTNEDILKYMSLKEFIDNAMQNEWLPILKRVEECYKAIS